MAGFKVITEARTECATAKLHLMSTVRFTARSAQETRSKRAPQWNAICVAPKGNGLSRADGHNAVLISLSRCRRMWTIGSTLQPHRGRQDRLGSVRAVVRLFPEGYRWRIAAYTIANRENSWLCRGGSSSLAFPGVHPETLRRKPPSTRRGETGWTSMPA